MTDIQELLAIVGGKTITINGKQYTYFSDTYFLVQVARKRGSFATRNAVMGNYAQAVALYNGINIGNGFKKRLLLQTSVRREVLAIATSR